MSKALIYLWLTLAKRKALQRLKSLRRPTTLIGFLAVAALIGFGFHFRHHEVMGHLVTPPSLAGAALIMFCGSLFRGFLQRGLAFEPPDIEFLFTSPLTQRQVLCYRLFSSYCFAIAQSAVFWIIFGSHLQRPVVAAACLALFQIVCFQVATAAAIYGGTIPELLYHRIRWMLLAVFFFITAVYLHAAWDLRLVPGFLASPVTQLLFYPAVVLPDAVSVPGVHRWITLLSAQAGTNRFWQPALYLALFGTAALLSFWFLLRQKRDIFEPALVTTARHAERRNRIAQGRRIAPVDSVETGSYGLPANGFFKGVGAIVWKNLVVARRSKHELLWVLGLAVIYTGFIVALLYLYHSYTREETTRPSPDEMMGFHIGVALFLAALSFFLQRMVPYDFRRDGHHLPDFRVLPFTSLGITIAELVVPTALCVVLQAPCIMALVLYGKFPLLLAVLVPAAYPAIALALNTVWNIHYLMAATQRASGADVSAVGTLIVVALSFVVFYPAARTALWLGQHLPEHAGIQLPLATALVVQYLVDLSLIGILARIYHRLELSRPGA